MAAAIGALVLLAVLTTPAAGRSSAPGPPEGLPAGAPRSEAPGPPAGLPDAARGPDRAPGLQKTADYEIWLPDQGTNTIHIYSSQLREVASIDFDEVELGGEQVVRPHMIDFDSQHRYAFVANTVSGNVAVVETSSREVVEVVDTGPGSHMAAVTPDDSAVWVAAIGAERFSEIPLDLDAEEPEFAVDRVIDTSAALAEAPFSYPSAGAVCHEYTADSRYAYLTFGPGAQDGGLVVVDLDAAELVQFFDPEEVRANCGLALSADGQKMYAGWGGVVATEPGQEDIEGQWYVFDTAEHEVQGAASSEGVDAHGVRVTPDGQHLWMVNRATSNAIVIDADTDEVVGEIPFVGESPDILDFSPDGQEAFISLRGPNPLSGPHAIAGQTPGFAVVDVASGDLRALVGQPRQHDEDGAVLNDPHGIGVRVLD